MRNLGALLLFATVAAQAQAPVTFSEGVIAFEKKEWAAAEKAMRATIAGNPTESSGTVRISGQWYETYVPHYFLARALAKQGKCAEAIREFEETERQGVTMQIGDFARHVTTRDACGGAAKPVPKKKVVLEATIPFDEDVPAPVATATVAPVRVPATPPRSPALEAAARARLAKAIEAYTGGRYEAAIKLLTGTGLTDRAAVGEAALFRAASRYALYRSGGATDTALRALVDSDLREYRALRPNATPDPRVFPPGFIALVR
jgi:hypothetical protein